MKIPEVGHYEQLGRFYLGREVSGDPGNADGEVLLYDSKDLLTHGVVLGMTGSGKTGLCMALLEEAAMDGIPAIVIDPKGDIANLMLAFPELAPKDFEPWVNEEEAVRKGMSREESAGKTAELWRSGLAKWGQGPERVRTFSGKVDVNIFTPGSTAGIPVSIMASLEAPSRELIEDVELFSEHVTNTVASLLAMAGMKESDAEGPEAVMLSLLFQKMWRDGQGLTMETLIHAIQSPPFDKVGVLDLETFLPAAKRMNLALKFNNVLASPGFAMWTEGVPLDIARMMHDPQGKPRISIFSIAHLSDDDRMLFTSLLLNQMLGWMRRQKGTTSLRALFYMDEIFGYLPPTANPPSKRPLMLLLKQSRAFGLGCLLATQNPVDLDYKALSNIGTWFLGRLQTERDQLRVLDGLQGAADAGGKAFDRAELERLLSRMAPRVFLMNNVHEDAPVMFSVRWVMSYLAGPMTRTQIKFLMDPKREQWISNKPDAVSNPMAMKTNAPAGGGRPVLGVGVDECFVRPAGGGDDLIYQPHLLRKGTVYFRSAKLGVDASRVVASAHPIGEDGIDWSRALERLPEAFDPSPAQGIPFAALPGYAMHADNYRDVEKEFSEHLYRNEQAEIATCPKLGEHAGWGESEGDFRIRLAHAAREARDQAIEKLQAEVARKMRTLEDRLRTAEGQLSKQKAEADSAKMQAGVSILGGILGGLLGRKTAAGTISRASSAAGRASSAYKQQQDVKTAESKVDAAQEKIEELEKETETRLEEIRAAYEPDGLELEKEILHPTRAGVKVDQVCLLWVPFTTRGETAC